ncbi:hypothetical protein BURPS305_6238 [Burkholderia pseudomallei 305]|uniref:Uncharacterized protein n=1 Tax=Burkholderia pseudomallei 1710a TaxID=320371 RepID=A0A0E1VSW2_BURPE|nr:hypothetical protein BMASAVP1_1252 [Burkholderia mallei SAVP1]EBA50508.1 hypothetical protein BURPS305_6238 [Burkholderia pseudomallei 305]EDU12236.1 hypothetical protein BURPS1655_D1112 [Burkholderia pseudomallei 1655]EET03943.1 hypothetical protein BURPS1710A_A1964 [Burkholderia pseudomallei 1710a]
MRFKNGSETDAALTHRSAGIDRPICPRDRAAGVPLAAADGCACVIRRYAANA